MNIDNSNLIDILDNKNNKQSTYFFTYSLFPKYYSYFHIHISTDYLYQQNNNFKEH
jgi:hypothetical protein